MKMWTWFFTSAVLLSVLQTAKAQGNVSSCFSSSSSSLVLLMSPLLLLFTGKCNNAQAADLVFLVDGSSSIGQANFLQVKAFMVGIIKPFASSVSPTGIRFGVVQYSDTSK